MNRHQEYTPCPLEGELPLKRENAKTRPCRTDSGRVMNSEERSCEREIGEVGNLH